MARKVTLCLIFMMVVCLVYACMQIDTRKPQKYINKRPPVKKGAGSDCELPKAVGDCRGRIRSFFFDTTSHQCRPFMYSGCGGNGNRFYRRDECHFACQYFMKLQPKNW